MHLVEKTVVDYNNIYLFYTFENVVWVWENTGYKQMELQIKGAFSLEGWDAE